MASEEDLIMYQIGVDRSVDCGSHMDTTSPWDGGSEREGGKGERERASDHERERG